MTTVQIDGRRVYIYRMSEGEYSSHFEDWWYHERAMTDEELHAHLLASLPAAEEAERAWHAERDAVARERFGCSANEVSIQFTYRSAPPWGHEPKSLDTPRGTLADAAEWYGDGDGPLWRFRARATLLRVAGFTELEPQATYEHEESPYMGEDMASVRKRLEGNSHG